MPNLHHIVKKGDTGKPLTGILSDENGNYAIPAGSTLHLLVTPDGDTTLKVNALTTINPDQVNNPGAFSYSWLSADVDTPGRFDIELLLTFPDAKVLRWPRDFGEPFGTLTVLPSKT